jgi:hypothetical protein
MIAINRMPPEFGFGNRILYYYNLRQFALEENLQYHCQHWFGQEVFQDDINGKDLIGNARILDPCLGEHFFSLNNLRTRDVFRLKHKPAVPEKTCAIHFRGTDFFQWNPVAVLNTDYYINAISEVRQHVERFALFTDDPTLSSYKSVITFLQKQGSDIFFGENTHNRSRFINDFSLMTECDWMISSPSTFCMCAGFMGKQKNIIHSDAWIKSRTSVDDKFWVGLDNGGNENYKLWKKI